MATNTKILKLPELKKQIARARRRGLKIAFTNGCFDILHAGHVHYLSKAKKSKRLLVVGLNSDRSVRAIKGPQRPIVPQKARAEVLAALICVDFVTIFNEPTPLVLIGAVKPDVLIKGADWKGKGAVGADLVRANGGRVEFVPLKKGLSSSELIKRIRIHAQTK